MNLFNDSLYLFYEMAKKCNNRSLKTLEDELISLSNGPQTFEAELAMVSLVNILCSTHNQEPIKSTIIRAALNIKNGPVGYNKEILELKKVLGDSHDEN
jgi:hypothetical protein